MEYLVWREAGRTVALYRESEDLDAYLEVLDQGVWKPAPPDEFAAFLRGAYEPVTAAAAAQFESLLTDRERIAG